MKKHEAPLRLGYFAVQSNNEDIHKALGDINSIRRQMARTTEFRGYGPATKIVAVFLVSLTAPSRALSALLRFLPTLLATRCSFPSFPKRDLSSQAVSPELYLWNGSSNSLFTQKVDVGLATGACISDGRKVLTKVVSITEIILWEGKRKFHDGLSRPGELAIMPRLAVDDGLPTKSGEVEDVLGVMKKSESQA